MASIPNFFGIDLGNSSIKICESEKRGKTFEIKTLESIPITSSMLENQSDQNLNDIADKISEVVKISGISTKKCVMSIPESVIFSRLVTLPVMKPAELDEAIHWAVKPLVSTPIETMNISYLDIDTVKKNGQDFVNWYVVGAPKDLVQKYQSIISKTKLELLAIETEALSLARVLFQNYAIQQDTLLIDIGAENTNFILSRNGVVVFSQTLGTGAEAMTKVIASDYGLDDAQAEKYKVTFGMDPANGDGKIAKSLEPVVEMIASEISRTIAYYNSKIGGQKISQIYLTEGGSNLLKLDEYLTNKVGISTVKTNLLNQTKLSGRLEKKFNLNNIANYGVAIGLSFKGRV